MSIHIPENSNFNAFAMIVDINGYNQLVNHPDAISIAQFTRDILSDCIDAIENQNVEVVGFMGDALLAFLENSDDVFMACVKIAKDLDQLCEYILLESDVFQFAPKGVSLKIGIEYGTIEVSSIHSHFSGTQKLFASPAINYAQRILSAKKRGNRCLIGPNAYQNDLNSYTFQSRKAFKVKGKPGEGNYSYYQLDLSDIWREGESTESYWG